MAQEKKDEILNHIQEENRTLKAHITILKTFNSKQKAKESE